MIRQLNYDGLAQMLNYHGSDLLQELCSKSAQSNSYSGPDHLSPSSSHALDFADVYQKLNATHKIDHKRHKAFQHRPSRDEEEFNMKLKLFLMEKLGALFHKHAEDDAPTTSKDPLSEESEAVDLPPPFETFLNLTVREEKEKFFKDCRPGDVVIGRIKGRDDSGLTVRLMLIMGRISRILDAFCIDVFIGKDDAVGPDAPDTDLRKFHRDQIVRGVIGNVIGDSQVVSMVLHGKSELKLGVMHEDDLPLFYLQKDEIDKSALPKYDRVLRNMPMFRNPTAEDQLCEDFGLENRGGYWKTSFLENIRNPERFGDRGDWAMELRKVQTHRMSMKSVMKGIERFKSGDNIGAMQCYTKALEVEENNPEALVARGALYANKESYDMAIRDFKLAHRADKSHVNARNYLLQTLLAKGVLYETDKKKQGFKQPSRTAIECYKEILAMEPGHEEAAERLADLTGCSPAQAQGPKTPKTPRTGRQQLSTEDDERPVILSPKQTDESGREVVCEEGGGSKASSLAGDGIYGPMAEGDDALSQTSEGDRERPPEGWKLPEKSLEEKDLTEALKKYYSKYNTASLSLDQQKELEKSGLMDKLKMYYEKYQNKTSTSTSHEALLQRSSKSSSPECIDDASSKKSSSLTTPRRPSKDGERKRDHQGDRRSSFEDKRKNGKKSAAMYTSPMNSARRTEPPPQPAKSAEELPKKRKLGQQDAKDMKSLKSMEDFISNLKAGKRQ